MENTAAEGRNLKTLAFMIIVALVMTILLRGVNSRMLIPSVLYIAVAVICALVGIIGYISFIYIKMFKTIKSDLLIDVAMIIALGVVVYFTTSFTIGVLAS